MISGAKVEHIMMILNSVTKEAVIKYQMNSLKKNYRF